jgi:4-alpha-glucanotransferase
MGGERVAGILLHPTSLPGPFGIGDLGPAAHRFAEFLAAAGQRLWQVLPLGPTGYGDSPYQTFSAFAGNPLLVSPEALVSEGLLLEKDLADAALPAGEVDYGAVIPVKRRLLDKAWERQRARRSAALAAELEAFDAGNAAWLDDFALFMALKDAHGGAAWSRWPPELLVRRPEALEAWRKKLKREIAVQRFAQFLFHRQWTALRGACRERGIRIMGDIPIFVAHDSADVWTRPGLFRLDARGEPAFVAGVPPDYFSATGQLWGNPLYRWDVMAAEGYRWWVERLRAVLGLVDLVRLDHFRGFEAYWEVPGRDETAVRGRWVKGPGAALFEALRSALGELPIVAENLGVITPEVEAIRERFGFPGMAILQFAFGTDPQGQGFRPHNYTRQLVVYTGTHDNDTAQGWWGSGVGDSTRSGADVAAERDFAAGYLDLDGREVHWAMIRTILASVADTAIAPLQDVLGLGSEARMNVPARPSGNWRWRFTWEQLDDALRERLRRLTVLYGRLPAPPTAAAPEASPGEQEAAS